MKKIYLPFLYVAHGFLIINPLMASAPYDGAVVEAAQLVSLGPRPLFLIQDIGESTQRERNLKSRLLDCAATTDTWHRSNFTIAHRGASLQFPEHTRESYIAAAQMGAGIIECDVTFTKDKELVCRHSQCDLHATTNILETALAEKCKVPPAIDSDSGELVNGKQIQCCTSDITLEDFKTLEGRMDGVNNKASNLSGYVDGTPSWRTDLYSTRGTLMTHAESIELFNNLGVRMSPELKAPKVTMPYNSMSQSEYAQKMIDEYKYAGVPASDVYPQTFNLEDIEYWIKNEPEFSKNAIYLDGRYNEKSFNSQDPSSWSPSMEELVENGVNILAPPIWMLLEARPEAREEESRIVPSIYAELAKAAGLELIGWSFERSGLLAQGVGWYYRTTDEAIDKEGDKMFVLDVLSKDVGVVGLFSDWPAAVTLYDNCLNRSPDS